MTKEDIIRMAREAGLHIATDVNWMPIIGLEYAERFAALIASDAQEKEREAIAKWLDDEKDATYWAELVRARGQA